MWAPVAALPAILPPQPALFWAAWTWVQAPAAFRRKAVQKQLDFSTDTQRIHFGNHLSPDHAESPQPATSRTYPHTTHSNSQSAVNNCGPARAKPSLRPSSGNRAYVSLLA